ncbi:MAG: hypothetical protein AVDCRST_MAG85-2090, partial [uncultured Solirubrobacteraceae bacterium]
GAHRRRPRRPTAHRGRGAPDGRGWDTGRRRSRRAASRRAHGEAGEVPGARSSEVATARVARPGMGTARVSRPRRVAVRRPRPSVTARARHRGRRAGRVPHAASRPRAARRRGRSQLPVGRHEAQVRAVRGGGCARVLGRGHRPEARGGLHRPERRAVRAPRDAPTDGLRPARLGAGRASRSRRALRGPL